MIKILPSLATTLINSDTDNTGIRNVNIQGELTRANCHLIGFSE